jgi:hypothetical protein
MNIATSGLILAGFVAFLALVLALFYIELQEIGDEYINLWYRTLWYGLAGVAVLSGAVAFLRVRLLPSRRVENEPQRRDWVNIAISGLILTGLVAFFGLVTALAYIALHDIADADINLWQMAFWCALAGVATLLAGLACLASRLFLTLAWIVAGKAS